MESNESILSVKLRILDALVPPTSVGFPINFPEQKQREIKR